MTIQHDPTKVLEARVSFDPAIDRDAMGPEFAKHFGHTGQRLDDARLGHRQGIVPTLPGQRACVFALRPMRVYERAHCDSLPTAESRWLRALSVCLVRVELTPPLATTSEMGMARTTGDGGMLWDVEQLDWLAERVGVAALYEIGAVAYARSKLGPFAGAFAPLPATSVFELQLRHQALADTRTPSTSDTSTTDAPST